MPSPTPSDPNVPQLSMMLRSFSGEDPGGWEPMLEHAVAMDRAGVDRLAVSDHVCFGEALDAYGDPAVGGTAGGRQPTGPDGHWLEPLTVLTAVAARTSRIRLSTGILLAALRRPVVLAKTAATIDVLSGGRLDLGVGVGWQREEYQAAGLPFERRGRLLDHTLEVCRTLWTEPRADHDSEHLHFEGIHQMPKPRQPAGVPIWVSGTVNPAAMARLATFGVGWIPWGDEVSDLPGAIVRMREGVSAADRDPSEIGVQGRVPVRRRDDGSVDLDATMKAVPALVEAGVTDVRLDIAVPDGAGPVERLGEVVGRFRAVTGRSD